MLAIDNQPWLALNVNDFKKLVTYYVHIQCGTILAIIFIPVYDLTYIFVQFYMSQKKLTLMRNSKKLSMGSNNLLYTCPHWDTNKCQHYDDFIFPCSRGPCYQVESIFNE